MHVLSAWGGSRYQGGVRSAWISPWPVGVGKLSKITDKYSTSNEHHARRLDLAILIVARRARRSAAWRLYAAFSYFLLFLLPFSSRSCADLLLLLLFPSTWSPCLRMGETVVCVHMPTEWNSLAR